MYVWSTLSAGYGSTGYGCQSLLVVSLIVFFFFPVPVRASKFGLARRVRPSRPASVRSFSTLKLNMVLTMVLSCFPLEMRLKDVGSRLFINRSLTLHVDHTRGSLTAMKCPEMK